jgi:anti-anti-sigma regulatory factor
MNAYTIQNSKSCLILRLELGFCLEQVTCFQAKALRTLEETKLNQVILDFSQLEVLDQHTFKAVLKTGRMLQLMSAQVVLCGFPPGIAAYLEDIPIPKKVRVLMDLTAALTYFEVG